MDERSLKELELLSVARLYGLESQPLATGHQPPGPGDVVPVIATQPSTAARSATWDELRTLARHWLNESRADSLPDLPPLTADQRRVINHSVLRNPPPAPPGRVQARAGAHAAGR